MSFQVRNFLDNDDITITEQLGQFSIAEYDRDLSVGPQSAQAQYYMYNMDVRRRQLVCELSKGGVMLQAGAMQWMAGNVQASSGVKGAGDFMGKMVRAAVTKESVAKPEYSGTGWVVCEPTYRHLILMDMSDWPGGVVLDDGLFLACAQSVKHSIAARSNFSSAIAGGEGLFNLCLSGQGVFCVESDCPKSELVTIEINNDELKIDGNYAIAWSAGLQFTVERTTKSLIGSAASGEGLVNVYRGTGKVIMQPVRGTAIAPAVTVQDGIRMVRKS